VEAGDFNRDGYQDIAELNSSVASVSVLLGNGDGTFQAGITSAAGGYGAKMTVGDFDHDGYLDLVTNQGGSLDVLKGKGDGSFNLPVPYYVGATANDVESEDVNHDGFDDLVTASFSYGGTTQLMLNNGDGTFGPTRNLAIGPNGLQIEVGDINGDGNEDLVQSGGSSSVGVLYGHGDGTFDSITYYNLGVGVQDMQVADFDGDGLGDLAVTSGSQVALYHGTAAGLGAGGSKYSIAGATRLASGDINGDGHLDLVANNGMALLGRGSGGFYAPTNYAVASGSDLALGDFNGDYGLDAVAATGAAAGVSVTLNGNNDQALLAGATHLVVSSPASTQAGALFDVTVSAVDDNGNVVPGFLGTVGISGAAGTQPVSYTFTAADGGTHTIANAATEFAAGNDSYSVTSPFLPDAVGTIAVTAGAVAKLSLLTDSNKVAGQAASVTVSTYDAYGNFAANYTGTVHFRSSDAQAGLPSDYTFTADDGGTHTFAATLKTAGSQTISAADVAQSAIAGTSGAVRVTPAAAASLSLSGGGGYIGSVNAVQITARDPYGNVATGYNGTVHLASSDANSLTSADAALVSGLGTFTVTPMSLGSQVLSAADLSDATISGSESINVTPGWGVRLSVTPLSATVAGQTQQATVKIYDAFGNISTVFTGWVAISSSDPRAPVTYQYFSASDAGVKSVPVTLFTAGSQAVTIYDAANPGTTFTQTGINVSPAAAASISMTPLQGVVAGTAQSFTVSLADAYGNRATGYRGTVNFSSKDTQAVLPAAYTFTAADAGSHTFSVTFRSSSGQDLTVRDSLNAGLTTMQRDIFITPAAMVGFKMRAPSNVTAGVPFALTLYAVDAYGNSVTGYTGTVHFTGPGGTNLLPADYTFTSADQGEHTFSVTLTSTGTQTINVQDLLVGSLKSSTSVKVTAQTTSGGGSGGGGGAGGGGKTK
jgi:hypothetical protein